MMIKLHMSRPVLEKRQKVRDSCVQGCLWGQNLPVSRNGLPNSLYFSRDIEAMFLGLRVHLILDSW